MKPVYRVMLISFLCLLLTLLSLGVGEVSLSPAETCHYLYLALTSPEGSGMVEQDVLQFIRLPHLVLSFFIGAGLAVCGAVMQAVRIRWQIRIYWGFPLVQVWARCWRSHSVSG